jgi:hypothetical protein
MFFLKTLTHKIQLHPSYFGPSLSDYRECERQARARMGARSQERRAERSALDWRSVLP